MNKKDVLTLLLELSRESINYLNLHNERELVSVLDGEKFQEEIVKRLKEMEQDEKLL